MGIVCLFLGHRWEGCLCRRCGQRKGTGDPAHAWDWIATEKKFCSLEGNRGSGQYQDPCYGADCQFCEANGREQVYICKNCGMEKREPI